MKPGGIDLVRRRLLDSAKKRLFYYKLITYTLLVSLLPISVISPLFYHNAKETMQQELQLAGTQYLTQTVNAMEIVTKNISNSFRQLSLDQVIREFEAFPRGAYYESLSGTYPEDDLPAMYDYLDRKARLLENLRYLKLSNEFIYSVYFYDMSKGMIITWDLLQYKPDQFFDPGWDRFAESGNGFPAIMEMRSARQPDGSYKEVIPIVYMSLTAGNYLVINLDASSIYNSFISKLDNKADSVLFVLSKSGKLMLYDKQNELNRAIAADDKLKLQLDGARQFTYKSAYGGRNMLVTGMSSDKLGWTFVTAAALDDMYRSVSNIKSIILLITFLLIVATGLLVFMTTRNIYNPIRHLLQFITHKDQQYDEGRWKAGRGISELKVIRSSLEEAYENRTSLQVRLRESLPASQEKFVRTLLRKHAIGRDEMAERMRFLELRLELDGLMAMLIALEESDDAATGVESENMNKLRFVDIVDGCLAESRASIVAELSEGVFVALINCGDAHEFQAHFMLAERIIREARETIGISCSIGIGKYCGDYLELPRAYEEAREALRYRSIVGRCEVIYIEDVRLVSTPLFVYPKEKEAALSNYVINGQTDNARRVLADMMKDIRTQQNKAHYRQVQHAFIQILGSFVAAANDLRLDLDKLMQAGGNLYSILLHKSDLNEVAAWFDEMIVRLTAHIDHAFQEKNNRHVDEVMRIIERDYGEQMSLTAAAEKLGLNPSYLSRIFKEKNGTTFSEYLTGVRIEKSKGLLIGTNMKVKEIGETVGYYKTNYFIKLFKEYTGVTPGDYRKMHTSA